MGKKVHSKKKFIGSKISRGTNNDALTPSGGDNQESTFESIIKSSTDSIISQLKANNEINNSILTALNIIPELDVHKVLKKYMENIEDKMVAMLGVMYGLSSATSTMKSQQFLNKLSKIDPTHTANRGIYETLKSIEDIITNIQKPSYDSQLQSIAKAIYDKLNDIKSNVTNADEAAKSVGVSLNIPEGLLKRLDALKDSIISNNSQNNILRVSDEIKEISGAVSNIKINNYEEHLNSIIDSLSELNNKVNTLNTSIVPIVNVPATDLQSVVSAINAVNASIDTINIPSTDLSSINGQLKDIEQTINGLKIDAPATELQSVVDAIKNVQQTVEVAASQNVIKSIEELTNTIKNLKQTSLQVPTASVDDIIWSNIIEQLADINTNIKNIKLPKYEKTDISKNVNDIISAIKAIPLYNDSNIIETLSNGFELISTDIESLQHDEYSKNTIVNIKDNEHHIDIEVKGISSDSLNKIIDIIKLQKNGDIDIDGLIENLSKFQAISKMPTIDYTVVNNIHDMIKILNDDIDTSRVNETIANLKNINLQDLYDGIKINGKTSVAKNTQEFINGYASVIDDILQITKNTNKLELPDNKKLSNIVNEVIKSVNSIKDIPIDNKSIKRAQDISKLINAVLGTSFNDRYYKDFVKHLRKIVKLTEKPKGLLTKFGLTDTGLLWTLINNISTAANAAGGAKNTSLKGIGEFLNAVMDIENNIDMSQLKSLSKKIRLLNFIIGESGLRATINEIKLAINEYRETKNILNTINSISNVLTSIGELDETSKASSLMSLVGKLILTDAAIVALIGTFALLKTVNTDELLEKITDIRNVLNNISELDISKMQSISDFVKHLGMLNVSLAAVGVTAPLAFVGLGAMMLETKLLNKVISGINDIEIDKEANDKVKNAAILILACGGVLMLGAILGQFVLGNFANIIGFTIALSTFILLTVGALNLATRGMDDAKQNATEFSKLLVICGTIMLLGGFIMTAYPQLITGSMLFTVALASFVFLVVNAFKYATKGGLADIHDRVEDLMIIVVASAAVMLIGAVIFKISGMLEASFGFTFMLAAFIGAVTYVYKWASKDIKSAQENAEQFSLLIAISAASLLVGGGLFAAYPWLMATTALFGVYLIAFIGAVTWAYSAASKGIESAQENAEQFGILIAISAATLLIGGGLFAKYPWLMLTTPLFGLYLVLFVGFVTWAYNKASKEFESAKENAIEFGMLIAISAATLLIGGGLFAKYPWLMLTTPLFGLYLVLFVGFVTWAYNKAGKEIKAAQKNAIAFGILIAISAATLLIGGMLMLENPGLPLATLEFVGLTLLITFGMSAAIWALGKINKEDLVKGELALAGIAAITWGFGKAFQEVARVSKIAKFDEILNTLKLMGIAVGAAAAFVLILAGVSAAGGGLGAAALAAGELALAGLVGIIDMAAGAIEHIAKAANAVADMKEIDSKKAVKSIEAIGSIMWSLKFMASPTITPLLMVAMSNTKLLQQCLSSVAKGVQDISNLTVPVINEEGRITGVRQLNENDFKNAAQNVKIILTTLGGAIIDTYNKKPEIFSTGHTFTDLLGMDTPFARVTKSCMTMGTMISKIAEGVRDYANLRIKTYDRHGKVIGSREMKTKDFVKAGINISTIILTLGSAIIDTYNKPGAKEMFEWKLIGDNPFAMVVKSSMTMGKMISTIANSVRDYANLRINEYDATGKVIGTREMNFKDFLMAGINVGMILSTLGAAVIATYKNGKEMFTDPSLWHTSADKTPFGMVVKAMAGTGKLISEGAKAINDVLALNVDWSEDGKKKLAKKVAFCISVLSDAIYSIAVDENGEVNSAFADKSWAGIAFGGAASDTPVGMVIASLKGSSALIKEGIKMIDEITKLPDYDKTTILNKVELALNTLSQKIVDLATNPETKAAFEDSSWTASIFGGSVSDTPVGRVKAALAGSSKLVNEGVTVIDRISKLNINTKTIGDIVEKVVTAIPNAILNSTIFNKNANIKEWWNDDPEDKFEPINNTYKSITGLFNNIITVYSNVNKAFSGIDGGVSSLTTILETIIESVPNTIKKATENSIEATTLDSVIKTYSKYKEAMDSLINIYSSIWSSFNKTGVLKDSTIVDTIGTGIVKMSAYMIESINVLNGKYSNGKDGNGGITALNEKVVSFADSMNIYQEGIINLSKAFSLAPDDTSKYDNVKKAIKSVNLEIANTPNMQRFNEETQLVKSYVRTVNSINVSKVDRLTNLADALTKMSTKLGSLEGLTDVLANKVSKVLVGLTERIDKSANIINTADKLQKDRHAKITAAIKELKGLMNKPLNVNVTHEQNIENNMVEGGTGSDKYTGSTPPQVPTTSYERQDSQPSNTQTQSSSRSTTTVQTKKSSNTAKPSETTTGPSERRVRDIAKEEINMAINNMKSNNNWRGAGFRTGAN